MTFSESSLGGGEPSAKPRVSQGQEMPPIPAGQQVGVGV